jgi:hypothetical protein
VAKYGEHVGAGDFATPERFGAMFSVALVVIALTRCSVRAGRLARSHRQASTLRLADTSLLRRANWTFEIIGFRWSFGPFSLTVGQGAIAPWAASAGRGLSRDRAASTHCICVTVIPDACEK